MATPIPTSRLNARLAYLLKRTFAELEDLHAEHLAPVGITSRELGVMLLLDGRDSTSQQQVAGLLGVDRTTMVGLIDALEAKALVARRPDAVDRRRNVVELTQDGRATLTRALRASDNAERQLLERLDARERTQLRGLLARLDRDRPQA